MARDVLTWSFLLIVWMFASWRVQALVPEISIVTNQETAQHNEVLRSEKWTAPVHGSNRSGHRGDLAIDNEPPSPNVPGNNTSNHVDDNFDVIDPNPTAGHVHFNPIHQGHHRANQKHVQQPTLQRNKNHKKHSTSDSSSSPVDNSAVKIPAKNPPSVSYWQKNSYDILPTSASTEQQVEHEKCSVPSTCPPFRLLERRPQYDIRQYAAHKWASTIVMNENRLLAQWEGLARLQEYFAGHNEQGVLMNETLPLLTQIKHGRHPGVLHELRDVTLSLPIPAAYQANPSPPISADILLDKVDASTVFVQRFKARLWELSDKALRQRADKFITTLRNHGESFYDRYYYLATYARPDNMERNTYELWIHATRLRDPSSYSRLRPKIASSRDPPLSKVTARTRKRLCRGVECPSFDVLRVYKFGIQKRRYFDTVLVSATTEECEFNNLSVWRGFMPLHLYKHGINSHWEVLEATRPIGIVHIRETHANQTQAAGPAPQAAATPAAPAASNVSTAALAPSTCRKNTSVSLYLPRRLHSNPPRAGIGAPSVKVTRVNDLIVYVHTVGGFLLDPTRSAIEVRKFSQRLQQMGICFRRGEYYLVIYDFLVRFHGRQNEIWLVADRCSDNDT